MRAADLATLLADVRARRPVAVATRLDGAEQRLVRPGDADALADAVATALRTDQPQTFDGWFVRPYNPPLRMVVVGAVHVAQALVPMAQLAGYAVDVVDPRAQWATEARFPGVALHVEWPDEWMAANPPDTRTAVVVLTHDPKIDDPALVAALRSPAFYVGALGSKRTHEKRRERLGDGVDRVHGPVGLDIGARTPAEIAISVLAQVTAVLRATAAPSTGDAG